MITRPDLVTLARSLRDEIVLSVYIDGTSIDPANKRPWRITLENALRDIRTWLHNSSHTEKENFERAASLLASELGPNDAAIGSPGWMAFITPTRVWYSGAVSAPMPTLAVWSTGICVSPCIRALKQERPVFVAVVDAKHSDIYRYELGVLRHIEHAQSVTHAEPPSHMGDAPRSGFHAGVHGVTGRDAMQRDRLEATSKMIRHVAARLTTLAGHDGAVLIGGTSGVVQQLRRELPPDVASRLEVIEDIDAQMSDASLTTIVKYGASMLRNRRDRAAVVEIIDLAAQGDRGALGHVDTRRALELRQVSELYVTRQFLDRELAEGEEAVRQALDQGAAVEQVSGTAAELLDGHGGVGARLRFVVPAPGEPADDARAMVGQPPKPRPAPLIT